MSDQLAFMGAVFGFVTMLTYWVSRLLMRDDFGERIKSRLQAAAPSPIDPVHPRRHDRVSDLITRLGEVGLLLRGGHSRCRTFLSCQLCRREHEGQYAGGGGQTRLKRAGLEEAGTGRAAAGRGHALPIALRRPNRNRHPKGGAVARSRSVPIQNSGRSHEHRI